MTEALLIVKWGGVLTGKFRMFGQDRTRKTPRLCAFKVEVPLFAHIFASGLGRQSAEDMGRSFRTEMRVVNTKLSLIRSELTQFSTFDHRYPRGLGEEDGLLRLHSTYRHDLKIYSSDEGWSNLLSLPLPSVLCDLI